MKRGQIIAIGGDMSPEDWREAAALLREMGFAGPAVEDEDFRSACRRASKVEEPPRLPPSQPGESKETAQ